MTAAAKPVNELKRLGVLRDLEILDTSPEIGFDKITRHLSQEIEVPIALVSLVDEERQWFKSCVGLDQAETERDVAICAHTILSDQPLVIEDATADPRTKENPLVTGAPGIRSYLGVPICMNGHKVGTVCVIDLHPRNFSARDVDLVKFAALWAQREIELRERASLLLERDQLAERAHELFYHAPYPLISLKVDGSIEEINLVGQGLWDIVGARLVQEHFSKGMIGGASISELIERVLSDGGTASLDPIELQSMEGATFYLQPSVVADPASSDSLILGLFDQTELVLAAQRMNSSPSNGQRLVEQRNFMARLSHEMRNSVNGILGLVELCRVEAPTREQMAHLEACVNALKELVDDTLEYDQIMRGQLSLESQPFDLAALCEELSLTTRRAANLKGLDFSLTTDLGAGLFVGDPLRVRQILSNLLSNAVKYTRQGFIAFEAGCVEDGVVFWVRDSGQGMTSEFQDHVFEPYSQVVSAGSVGGVGLGLAIVGELLRSMKGSVDLESTLGQGTQFKVFLPLSQVKPEKRSQTSDKELPELNLRVLVVDDNATNRTVMKAQLHNLGCSVELAEHGVDALERLPSFCPDLVFLDCHMPEMDGFEAARRIVAQPELYGSPILIALTASVDQKVEQRCRDAGMHHFLQKPLRFVDLCFKLNSLRESNG